ncbi:MAG: hypothetical protein OIN87_00040 [Candidatus Methanoperedens sp.]|nr:hypothetical protein [Candidatus Methanoperedens sp.]
MTITTPCFAALHFPFSLRRSRSTQWNFRHGGHSAVIALKSGFNVIEEYSDDPRGVSCLLGNVELSLVDVEVGGVVVKDMPAEVCSRCNPVKKNNDSLKKI